MKAQLTCEENVPCTGWPCVWRCDRCSLGLVHFPLLGLHRNKVAGVGRQEEVGKEREAINNGLNALVCLCARVGSILLSCSFFV